MPAPSTIPLMPCVRPVSELRTRSVAWLWPGRLALGKLAILDGDPGLGKSLVTLDLCARLSTGRTFPDGGPGPGASSALVLNGEDGEEDTIRPRLQALGADLERIFVVQRGQDEAAGPLYFPDHAGVLDEALSRTRARLVLIDPIVAFLAPTILDSSDQSVRRALFPLARLAEKHACAILLVRHLNKRGSGRSVYRGNGSIGFLGACRSGWLIARDPHDPARCVFAQVKNNLAPVQPSLTYKVTPQESGPPTLCWGGATFWTADQLLAAGAGAALATQLDRACDFLTGFLANGPRTSREVWADAQEQELSEKTVERAKHDLAIRSVRVYAAGKRLSYWLLPGQLLPETAPPEDAPSDLEPWLAPLREQFPLSTPLDEL
jgi:AAA domain